MQRRCFVAAHTWCPCTTGNDGTPNTPTGHAATRAVLHSPLYLRQELRLKDAPGLQRLRDLPPEEETPLGQIDQNLPDDLPEVHAAAHLLVSDT